MPKPVNVDDHDQPQYDPVIHGVGVTIGPPEGGGAGGVGKVGGVVGKVVGEVGVGSGAGGSVTGEPGLIGVPTSAIPGGLPIVRSPWAWSICRINVVELPPPPKPPSREMAG